MLMAGSDSASQHGTEAPGRSLTDLRVTLISTYEMGRQPFGLASPAAWLRERGAVVRCIDASRDSVPASAVTDAHLVAFYLPMHTATRLAVDIIGMAARANPRAHLCAYGLYAPLNAGFLRTLGVATVLGGEFELGLVRVAERVAAGEQRPSMTRQPEPEISTDRLDFRVPDRNGLPGLERYASLTLPDGTARTVGYTESSRGCKHSCRHCPIVPVYEGRFRIVAPDVVLADIASLVEAGAEHITFGDPDFFNGIKHATDIVTRLHRQFPALSYDVTIKVEHLLKHRAKLPVLRETGCAFVVSAVEAVDDRILRALDKGHTRNDFVAVAALLRHEGLVLVPTFVAFNPWITIDGYADLLATVAELGLVEHVAPVQLAIRLLIPSGSKLLELPDIRAIVGAFDERALVYRWQHPDSRVDALQAEIERAVQRAVQAGVTRAEIFEAVREVSRSAQGRLSPLPPLPARSTIPYLTEPWYC